VTLGDAREAMVVCRWATELLGLVGGSIVGAGLFEAAEGDHVSFLGETARALDLGSIYARLQGGAWAERWGG
jgi:hypothetical protein